ncbi:MAG: tetratricopeptide repeat protein [Planctomycetes bacterium]|nr:tetratricopeptide repeat protein [Planctomycetota bacterium]
MPGAETGDDARRRAAAVQRLVSMVRQAYEAGRFAQAETLCEQLLAQAKDDAQALYLMGSTLFAQRRYDESAAHLERAARRAPKNAAVRLTLARALKGCGRLRAALQQINRSLRLDPDGREAVEVKADILDASGEHEQVRTLLEPVREAYSHDAAVAYYLARGQEREGRRDDAIALARRGLAPRPVTEPRFGLEPDPSPTRVAQHDRAQRRRLGFFLGQLLERAEDFDGAFGAYETANLEEPVDLDPGPYHRLVDALIETFDAELLAHAPRAAHGLEHPILIVGMPRTGSTLVEQILDRHPLVHGAGESYVLRKIASGLPLAVGSADPYPLCVTSLDAEVADRVGREYVQALRATGPVAAQRVVDKNLANFENLGLVSLIVPRARVIHCRRDPVNTCFSCFATALDWISFDYATDLEAVGRRYLEYERLITHWNAVLGEPILEVDYEQLVDEQEAVTRTILEFLGLPWEDRCLRFHESSRPAATLSQDQVRRPVYRSSVRRADRFGAHLEPLRRVLGGA